MKKTLAQKRNRVIVWILAVAGVFSPAALYCRADDSPIGTKKGGVDQDTVAVDPKTEKVIHGALKFLASQQEQDGSFADDEQAAITGYVLIAFLSGGELPDEGEFGKNVTKGMQFLMGCVRPDGYIASSKGGSNMYGHGIGTIALAELYGQTKDVNLRPKLEKAVKLLVSCQNSEGGWRYSPKPLDADISVTVLQTVALRAAQNSGIAVPQSTIDRAVDYVKTCSTPSGGFTYQAYTGQPGFARTAAAVYAMQVCGRYNDPQISPAVDFLFDYRFTDTMWFTYGNFYAAPALYMRGGKQWALWYQPMHDLLLKDPRFHNDPSTGMCFWTPLDPGGYRNGVSDVYATAVYTMILAMPYHYIPLYQR